MKVVLKSVQDYSTHKDEFTEEFECVCTRNNDSVKIEFENGYIEIFENKIVHERGENKFIIEPSVKYEVDYDTAHGIMVLDIEGIEIEHNPTPETLARVKYLISMVGIEPYTNELYISLS